MIFLFLRGGEGSGDELLPVEAALVWYSFDTHSVLSVIGIREERNKAEDVAVCSG